MGQNRSRVTLGLPFFREIWVRVFMCCRTVTEILVRRKFWSGGPKFLENWSAGPLFSEKFGLSRKFWSAENFGPGGPYFPAKILVRRTEISRTKIPVTEPCVLLARTCVRALPVMTSQNTVAYACASRSRHEFASTSCHCFGMACRRNSFDYGYDYSDRSRDRV